MYAKHLEATQAEKAKTNQVENSSGGFSFAVDDWKRLERFLILGSDAPSYYATARQLTRENAACVERCVKSDGRRAVAVISQISDSGRATKNDPAVFALALAAAVGDEGTRSEAYANLSRVCRTATHLFGFVSESTKLRGGGSGWRRAVGDWYRDKGPAQAAYQAVKYQQRDGWSHRDVLRLARPKVDGELNDVLHWAVRGWPGVGEAPHPSEALRVIWAFERAKVATTEAEIIDLIRSHGLVREAVPTKWLNSNAVWEALIEDMPLTAMVRNLAKMSSVGLLAPLSDASRLVRRRLEDAAAIRRARLHPLTVLLALRTYASGRGLKGSLTWSPLQEITAALDAAFYSAFAAVEPTGRRHLLAVDVSGSMSATVAGTSLSCREAAAALACVTAAAERECHAVAFTSGGWSDGRPSQLAHAGLSNGLTAFDPRGRLEEVVARTKALPMGGTDCALPMLYAAANNVPVDVFVVLTDSETWAGSVHPHEALKRYRQRTGIPAKMAVVGMVANNFSIADPDDGGMLDVTGFSTDVPVIMSDFARSGV